MTHRRTPRAFTLVEILVVIAIIAICIGLLAPALARARQSAIQITCASNLRQWGQAMQIYINTNNGWLPRRGQGVQYVSIINRPSDWFNALPPLMRNKPYSELAAGNDLPRPGQNSVWICPTSVDLGYKYHFGYAMNMKLSTWNAPTPDRSNRVGNWSTMVFLTEGCGCYCSTMPAPAKYSPVARHRGLINIAFLDGHVASFVGKEIGVGVGDPNRSDVRWTVPGGLWNGPQ